MSIWSVTVLVAAVASGCGGPDGDEEPRRVLLPEADRAPAAPRREPMFGGDGQLLESEEVIAGLTLPRGLEPSLTEERRHVYLSHVPIHSLKQYFGQRLVTGEVDAVQDGAIYRNAVPRDARGGVVRLEVSILPVSRHETRIEVVEIRPPQAAPPSEAEVLRRAAQDRSLTQ